MSDNEEPNLNPAYLAGKIEALEKLLLIACSQLPERAMHHIAETARRLHRHAEADRNRNDVSSDRADGMWEVATRFDEVLSTRVDELEEGAIVRTVQPASIPREDQLFPERGW